MLEQRQEDETTQLNDERNEVPSPNATNDNTVALSGSEVSFYSNGSSIQSMTLYLDIHWGPPSQHY